MWSHLTIADMRIILSEDEVQSLKTLSLDVGIDRIQSCLDLVSDTWRAAIRAKGYELYNRDYWTPSSLHIWILIHARYTIWTNFPMSPSIALDEARKAQYEEAMGILKNIPFSVEAPDYSDDPEADPGDSNKNTGSIFVPYQRLDRWYYYPSNPWDFHKTTHSCP